MATQLASAKHSFENSRLPAESCSDSIDIGSLPAIGRLPRSQCRSCNREGRSLWSGLRGWCP